MKSTKPTSTVCFDFKSFNGNKPTDEDILKAIAFLKGKKQVRCMQLQLEFKKGYNWASKIMDILENNLLVSKFDGETVYRKVIADESFFDSDIIILDIESIES